MWRCSRLNSKELGRHTGRRPSRWNRPPWAPVQTYAREKVGKNVWHSGQLSVHSDFHGIELRENVARCHSGSVLESRNKMPLFFAVERKTSPACCDRSNSSIKSRTLVSIRISTAEIRERKQKQKQTLDKNSGDEGQSVANFSSRYQTLNSKYSS